MVLLGLVMWPPQLCSISLCRSSPNHDGNCQGQISHICWIMVTTIDWAQLSEVDFLCMCVCYCERANACRKFWVIFLINYMRLHAYSSWVFFHPVHILAQQLLCAAFVQHLYLFAFALFCIKSLSVRNNQPLTASPTDVTFLMREEETWGNCPDKFGKAWVMFCDAFPTRQGSSTVDWGLFFNYQPSCLRSFNKVCFYTRKAGRMYPQ